jgi:hypothetical protein
MIDVSIKLESELLSLDWKFQSKSKIKWQKGVHQAIHKSQKNLWFEGLRILQIKNPIKLNILESKYLHVRQF